MLGVRALLAIIIGLALLGRTQVTGQCQRGQYGPNCTPCPPPLTTSTCSATTINDCQCDGGLYRINSDSTICDVCPDGGICVDVDMRAKDGWWLAPANDLFPYPRPFVCQVPGSCAGGQCPFSRRGPTCFECAEGYGDTFDLTSECEECPFDGVLVFGRVILVVVYLFLFFFLISSTFLNHPMALAPLKLLCNFLQILGLIAPSQSTRSLHMYYAASRFVSLGYPLTLTCSQFSPPHLRVFAYWVAPISILLLYLAIRGVLTLFYCFFSKDAKRTFKGLFDRNLSTAAFLVFSTCHYLMFMIMVQSAVTLFWCVDIHGTRYAHATLTFLCDSDEHRRDLYIGIAMFTYYIFVVLVVSFVMLRRFALCNPDAPWGIDENPILKFFLAGYKTKFYYWDLFQIGRKLALVIVFEFYHGDPTVSRETAPRIMLATVIVSMALTHIVQPYDTRYGKALGKMDLGFQFLLVLVLHYSSTPPERTRSAVTILLLCTLSVCILGCIIFIIRNYFWGRKLYKNTEEEKGLMKFVTTALNLQNLTDEILFANLALIEDEMIRRQDETAAERAEVGEAAIPMRQRRYSLAVAEDLAIAEHKRVTVMGIGREQRRESVYRSPYAASRRGDAITRRPSLAAAKPAPPTSARGRKADVDNGERKGAKSKSWW